MTNIVSIEPLSAPQIPTACGSVASERDRKPRSSAAFSLPSPASREARARLSGAPSPARPAARSELAGSDRVSVRRSIAGSSAMAEATSRQASPETSCAPSSPRVLAAKNSITCGSPWFCRLCWISTGSESEGSSERPAWVKSTGISTSARWNPPRPLISIVVSRNSSTATDTRIAARPSALNRRSDA